MAVYEASPEAVVKLIIRLLGIIEQQAVQIAQLDLFYQHVTKLFSDILGFKISPATIVNTESSCFAKLEGFENEVKHFLKQPPAINLDETGLKINASHNAKDN
ncbi:MAG: transposase [Methanolobus sp.]|nr:transposase [Methanolobus sp.]